MAFSKPLVSCSSFNITIHLRNKICLILISHTHTLAGSLLPLVTLGGGCGIDHKHQEQLYEFTLSLELITIHPKTHTHPLINANLRVDAERLNPLL